MEQHERNDEKVSLFQRSFCHQLNFRIFEPIAVKRRIAGRSKKKSVLTFKLSANFVCCWNFSERGSHWPLIWDYLLRHMTDWKMSTQVSYLSWWGSDYAYQTVQTSKKLSNACSLLNNRKIFLLKPSSRECNCFATVGFLVLLLMNGFTH